MKPNHLLHAPGRRWMVITVITFTALWLFAANSTPASAATTWTVTTLTDRNNASCILGDCSLREAIKSANAGAGGDTINFVLGLNGTIVLTVGALPNIAKSVTIDGGGVITISAANSYRVFYVNTGVTLTLNSIILENGNSGSNYGGAIYVDHGTLVLNNSTVQNSQTNGFEGSAIFSTLGAVTLNNSVIQGNTGHDNGAISSSGILTLTNSIVRNNTATAGGGGLFVSGRVAISNSQIYSNTASSEYGGALRTLSGAQVSINNSQIYSNHADNFNGGGIYNLGTLTVTQSTLSGNSARFGSGIYNYNSTATLTNVTLSGNSATIGGFGGGIFNNNNSTATLTNVTLSGNSAGDGGGIFNESSSTATLTNVTLSGNSATNGGSGGGIYNFNGTATLTNVTFSGNSAGAGGFGGGISHYGTAGKTITLKNTIVANSPLGGNCSIDGSSVTSITSTGFNLSSDNTCTTYFNQAGDQNNKSAQLGPLANNGGFTLTHLPLPPIVNGTGPIDNGTCAVSPDQRGVSRPQGIACDIGAVEYRTGDMTPWLYLPLIRR